MEETINSAKWYVVHTFSGYENKVKMNIEKAIKNRNMEELIQAVEVPLQDEIEEKNGVEKTVQRKVFPGYVLIKMVMTDDTWYIVRNTRGVTGFVGPDSKPVSLTEEEIAVMGIDTSEKSTCPFEIGERVVIEHPVFNGHEGIVTEINEAKKTLIVELVDTKEKLPTEVSFDQVSSIEF